MKRLFEFNPYRKDASKANTDKAHFVTDRETVKRRSGIDRHTTRWFVFTIGASDQEECWNDKFRDDKALELFRRYKGTRWVLKGYTSPAGKHSTSNFTILTHIALYHRKLKDGLLVINPETGEEGSYYAIACE